MRKSSSGSGWWLQYLVILAVCLCAVSMPKPVKAAPSVGTGVSSTTAIINKIINSTPGLNKVVTTGTGVTVTATGETAAAARGIVIPVGAEASAAVSAGRIAGIAARAIKVGSWIGVASVVAPWIMDQAGIKVCPPPDFFCKAGPGVPTDPTTGGWFTYFPSAPTVKVYGSSQQDVCDKFYAQMPASTQAVAGPLVAKYLYGRWSCYGSKSNGQYNDVSSSSSTCPAGSTKAADGVTCLVPGPSVPATEADVGDSLEKAITNQPTRIQFLYGGLQANNAPIWSSTDPVTVKPTAAVVTAPVERSVETVPKPDGSIDTITKEVKTEVKPVVTGTNLGDTKIDYPTTVTTTTTTTNNVTNVTTTTTNVTNIYASPQPKTTDNPPDPGPPPPLPQTPDEAAVKNGQKLEIPTDYNREVTQQKILSKLEEGFGKITAEVPKGDDELKAIKDQNDKGVAAVDDISEASIGLKGWFPDIPTATCVNPKVGSYTGTMFEVPICDKVSIFQTFISGVVCCFALFGCVREVQAALKA